MKGTEKIIAHIRSDAKAQADAILAQAEQQCAGIRADYEEKARVRYGERIRAGVRECQDGLDSRSRIDHMESKKDVLALKQEMVSLCFDKARERIVSLPAAEYTELLSKLAARASVTGDEEVILNARDRAAVGEAVVKAANAKLPNGALTLSDAVGGFEGGLILRRGSIEVNCTAELLVELCRSDMSAGLADVLFE